MIVIDNCLLFIWVKIMVEDCISGTIRVCCIFKRRNSRTLQSSSSVVIFENIAQKIRTNEQLCGSVFI